MHETPNLFIRNDENSFQQITEYPESTILQTTALFFAPVSPDRLLFQMAKGVLEIESEHAGILSDNCGCHYIEDVVVSFLWKFLAVCRQEAPKVPVTRTRRQLLNKWNDLPLTPVVRRHHE